MWMCRNLWPFTLLSWKHVMIHGGSLMLVQVNDEITMCSSNPTSGYILRRTENRMSDVCFPVCTTLFTVAKR